MTDRPDEELIADYLQGRAEAFEMLFRRYKKSILNFALRFLGNRADAEDVTADVFVTLYSKRYTPQPQAKFSTWLFTVARNACISQIRKRRRFLPMWFTQGESGELEQWEIPDARNLPSDDLDRKETAIQIRQAVTQLPEAQREAVILREYHEMSYQDIAQVMGCSLERVKILIFRGRERLRQELSLAAMEDTNGGT
jgi:RNA polymerase sigma-70 factor (ECF subfamily)